MTTASKHLPSKEVNNFLRLCNVLFNLSSSAIRFIFDHEFCPETLKRVLSESKNRTILDRLKTKKTISGSQWESLFPLGIYLLEYDLRSINRHTLNITYSKIQ